MKKAIIMIALVTFSVSNSLAQESTTTDNRNKLSFGVKIGANYSNVYDSDGEDFVADGKFGIAGGVFAVIPLGSYIGVQPEVLFSQKGFKSEGSFLGTDYKMTRTTDFIDVPIFLSVKPVEFVSILFGSQFSYLLKRTDKFTGGSLDATQEEEFENEDLTKNIFGLTGGADINIDHFVIGVRAGWDLKKNVGSDDTTTPRYKNMWYQATVGFKF
jgi:hypothetical protein